MAQRPPRLAKRRFIAAAATHGERERWGRAMGGENHEK